MKGVGVAFASIGIAALAHVPCCGLPIVLSLVGVGTGASELLFHGPFGWLFTALSVGMSVVSIWLVFRQKKTGCSCDKKACVHQGRTHWAAKAFVIALTLTSLTLTLLPHNHEQSHHEHTTVSR